MSSDKKLPANNRRRGKGLITPEDGIATRFSKTNQPTSEALKKGHRKSKLLTDLLELSFKGSARGRIKQTIAKYLGIPEEELTVEDMLHARQIERAISKSNTFAYMAVMDRAYGKPKQVTEEVGDKKIIVTMKK